MWKTVTTSEHDGGGQTRGIRLACSAHSPDKPGLQSPHTRERARKSTRPGQRAFAATREPAGIPPKGVTGLGGKRYRSGQNGHSSRGGDVPPGRYGKHTAGRRATGEVVQDPVSTEV